MKRILALITTLILAVTLVTACGSKENHEKVLGKWDARQGFFYVVEKNGDKFKLVMGDKTNPSNRTLEGYWDNDKKAYIFPNDKKNKPNFEITYNKEKDTITFLNQSGSIDEYKRLEE